jgi:hypothetical protein
LGMLLPLWLYYKILKKKNDPNQLYPYPPIWASSTIYHI